MVRNALGSFARNSSEILNRGWLIGTARHPGKWIPFCRTEYERRTGHLPVKHRLLYLLHAFALKSVQRPKNFSKFLDSFRLLSRSKLQRG